jgi:pyridoxamine 5'-phosphate oxidase
LNTVLSVRDLASKIPWVVTCKSYIYLAPQFLNLYHMSLPPWRTPIARALHRNRSLPNARYLQLATIDSQGYPANRTVVFRGWHDPYSELQFVTDVRSAKITEILHNPQAEACWYFPKTREQFRIRGHLKLIDREASLTDHYPSSSTSQPARQQAWQQLSSKARSQFFWPTPGHPRDEDALCAVDELLDLTSPSDNFGLLLLAPQRVDQLELKSEPQNRWRYELWGDHWSVIAINP